LSLKEYNAAHEPTHIYSQFFGGYTFGFALDISYWSYWGHRAYWG